MLQLFIVVFVVVVVVFVVVVGVVADVEPISYIAGFLCLIAAVALT